MCSKLGSTATNCERCGEPIVVTTKRRRKILYFCQNCCLEYRLIEDQVKVKRKPRPKRKPSPDTAAATAAKRRERKKANRQKSVTLKQQVQASCNVNATEINETNNRFVFSQQASTAAGPPEDMPTVSRVEDTPKRSKHSKC